MYIVSKKKAMLSVGEKLYRSLRENSFPDIETMNAFHIYSADQFYKYKDYSMSELTQIIPDETRHECTRCNRCFLLESTSCPNCNYAKVI